MNLRSFLTRVITPCICLAVVLGAANAASACPSCQAALSADGSDLSRGIYYSILFMLSVPIAIIGTFGGMVYRAVKREQRRRAEAGEDRQPRGF